MSDAPKELGPLLNFLIKGEPTTWATQKSDPAGYNVMPLPQATAPNQFILSAFTYYETMAFSIIGKVPNRGGTYQQDGYALAYEQRVNFGSGPRTGQGVHAENGIWINLLTTEQKEGPFQLPKDPDIPSPPAPTRPPPQDPSRQIVKQVSVPHGNSILAVGPVFHNNGAPTIGNVSTLPTGPGVNPSFFEPYGENVPANPNVNPNIVLTSRNEGRSFKQTVTLHVSSKNPGGGVSNIVFEQKRANVNSFSTTFWLSELTDGSCQLQYTQTMELTLIQHDVTFIHIDAATLLPEG